MHSFIITESRDSLLGMRLAGVDGVRLKEPDALEKAFKKAVRDSNIAIVFMTELAYDRIRPVVDDYKQKNHFPLITIIPDRDGFHDPERKNIVSHYIKQSVGL